MRKLKVMTIVGTRPEIIRLSRLIPKLDQHCEHVLVHTGQNYDCLYWQTSMQVTTWQASSAMKTSGVSAKTAAQVPWHSSPWS